jgi:cysteine sulfinate desulfinase/cysteine desulfurase-like protein
VKKNHLSGMVNLIFDGVSGELLMNILNLKGFYVFTSSACSLGKDAPLMYYWHWNYRKNKLNQQFVSLAVNITL